MYVKQGKFLKHYCINLDNDFEVMSANLDIEKRGMQLEEEKEFNNTTHELQLTVRFEVKNFILDRF